MRMAGWLLPATMTLILWGVWGLFQKLATNQMPPRSVYFFASAGALSVVLIMLAMSTFPMKANFEGAFFGVLAGVCSSLGGLLFLQPVGRVEQSETRPSYFTVHQRGLSHGHL